MRAETASSRMLVCGVAAKLLGLVFNILATVSIDLHVDTMVVVLLPLRVTPFVCMRLRNIVSVVGIPRLLLSVVVKVTGGPGMLDVAPVSRACVWCRKAVTSAIVVLARVRVLRRQLKVSWQRVSSRQQCRAVGLMWWRSLLVHREPLSDPVTPRLLMAMRLPRI